ncbi:hypothetical protein PR048_005817 [Dryococelus australis]|uniref:K Homology domain-containing protein n=1 Tax=Dryococelus australis TaxID=614101 RepID=A0ABQ9IAC1_9NEOP|nr:hypothetical protein PR048_005817 [Dryococelus australis]
MERRVHRCLEVGDGQFHKVVGRGGAATSAITSHLDVTVSIPAGSLPDCGTRAGRCRWSVDFLGGFHVDSALAFQNAAVSSPLFTLIAF